MYSPFSSCHLSPKISQRDTLLWSFLFIKINTNSDRVLRCRWGKMQIIQEIYHMMLRFLWTIPLLQEDQKQSTVSRSTVEAEYRSMGHTCCELKWISYLPKDFNIKIPLPVNLYCDNQAAIAIAKNHVFHERTKHVEINCHIIRSHVESGFIQTPYISSQDQLPDPFTKPISAI